MTSDRNPDSKSLSQEQFAKHAQGYVTSKTHAEGVDLDRLVEIAQPKSDWIVLDVATGGGHTALKFAPHVQHVIASDLTPKMLEAAEKHLTEKGANNVEFKIADAENLPFEDAIFDLVTCRIAPHHFPDCAKFVRESARVLKSGGMLLVQDQVLPVDSDAAKVVDSFEKLRDPSHNYAFSQEGWESMFRTAALSIEHTEQHIKRHEFITWAERMGNTPETIAQLVEMMNRASDAVLVWMELENWNSPDATFVNHHLIIAGRKA